MLEFLHDKSERKVKYIELIYDLIFVYLVSQNGHLLETIQGGFITTPAYLTYLASMAIILQIWYVSTLFLNRYGCDDVQEMLVIFINMYLLYYMANGIQADWGPTYFRYNLAWTLILLNLAAQYFLRLRLGGKLSRQEWTHIRCQILILLVEAAIVLASIPIYLITGAALSPWAVVFGFAASILTRNLNTMVPVDFPHLSERVMLYVVFTFGEMILGITGYFSGEVDGTTIYYSLMAFLLVAGLFTGYGYYYDHLLDRNAKTTGTGYIVLHMVMLLALNNITAGLGFMRDGSILAVPKNIFLTASLLVYFLCLLGTQRYAVTRVGGGRKFYIRFIVELAAYCVLVALCYRWSRVNIALAVVFIYIQLLDLRRAGMEKPPTEAQ